MHIPLLNKKQIKRKLGSEIFNLARRQLWEQEEEKASNIVPSSFKCIEVGTSSHTRNIRKRK
jgi:hypothetical protein